ncbi:MAG: hypothetical protein GWP91_15230 [Rhodobacterales bacterium]|nr:hypothetical protein [Rhodobacterales bacterium]
MWILALLACGGPTPDAIDETTEPTQASPIQATDAERVRALIAGDALLDDVRSEVAWSDGWPVQDGDQWLFLAVSDTPPQLAGDFNDWVPEAMTAGDGFYWSEVQIADATGLAYKFVAADSWTADPWARSYNYDANGEISFVPPSTSTYHLERWPHLSGAGLEARDVRIYVPQGDGPWPVLYMHDGQNLFNPEAMWGGWRLQDTLVTQPSMLVVGVDNTPARMDEYTHVPDDIGTGEVLGGQGNAYADLLHNTLRPHVEATYPVTDKTGLLGSSLGGLISLHIAQTYPGEYDFVGSMSGTLGWGRFELTNDTMADRWLADAPTIAVYIDSGGDAGANGCEDLNGDGSFADDPDATDNYCTSQQLAQQLAQQGFAWDETLWHWHEVGAEHNELYWADRVFRPIQLFADLP